MIKTRDIYFWTLFFVGLGVFLFIDYSLNRDKIEKIEAEKVESVIENKKRLAEEYFDLIKNTNLDDKGNKEEIFRSPETPGESEGIAIGVLRKGSFIYWTDNTIPYDLLDTSITSRVIKLKKDWYWVISEQSDANKLFALILIKKNYSYENQYIQGGFHKAFQLPKYIQVKTNPENGVEISDNYGNYLFSLTPVEYTKQKINALYVGLGYIILYIFLLFLVYRLLALQSKKKFNWLRLGIVVTGLLLLRYIMVTLKVPSGLYDLRIFDPAYYATSSFIPSLGDLLFLLTSIWIVLFSLVQIFREKLPRPSNQGFRKYLFAVLLILVNIAWFLYSYDLHYSIIYNSSINLSLYNFFSLSIYSVFAMFSIFLLLVNYFFVQHFIGKWLREVIEWKQFITVFVLVSLVAGFFVSMAGYSLEPVIVLFFLIINLVFSLFLFKYPSFHYTRNVIVLFISVAFVTYFSELHSDIKEKKKRKILVTNLENERDRVGEYLLQDLSKKLENDRIIKDYMDYHLQNEANILDYIQNEYFNGYFRKYDIQVSVCNPQDELEVDRQNIYHCYSFFDQMLNEEGIPLPGSDFYFLDNLNGRISYMGLMQYDKKTWQSEKTLYIALDSKLTNTHLGYPKLLLDKDLIKPGPLDEYSYAKYKSGSLLRRSGDYSFPMELTKEFSIEKEFQYIYSNDYNHLVYNPDEKTTILISQPRKEFFDILAQFSYIFAFFYILFILFVFFFNFPGNLVSFRYNFKNKIKLSMILLLFLSLLTVGTGTVYYTTLQFKKKQKETISEKIQSINIELENKLGFEPALYPEYKPYLVSLLRKFSSVFYVDMNLYDLDGQLLASSRPQVFEKGLLGEKMNPEAYSKLAVENQPKFIHTEMLGNLKYHSAYVPFYNTNGQKLAYLNLPYFTRQQALQKEVYTIVMVMVNIYVFLIILGTIIAVLVSNNITKPLRLIQQNLRKIGLQRQNEKIDYYSHDEVGELIREYNRVVEELEENARKLAQTERESAWREMAKQIAHEIKNPLTPMKLKVQYLKRAWDDRVSNFDERMKQFTESMISQINTLSGIATEFSNFAKMPRAKNEKISIHEQVNNIVSLYENNEHIDITLNDQTNEQYYVYADQDQIGRVLNNLVKNAIQAIPKNRKGRIEIGLERMDHRVLISISDNGAGISDSIKEKLFAPNFTTKSSGMGMGLAISRKIIEDAGGKIWYDTELDKGTTFYVEMPIYKT